MWYFEALKQKDDAESMVSSLPEYFIETINNYKNPSEFQIVIRKDTDSIVGVVGGKYKLVQHREAFMPIIDGLNYIGEQYKVAMGSSDTKAWISVFTTETEDGVSIGFQAINSVNGTTSLRYGFSSTRTTRWIELVGYRQVCSNGMVIRVPLKEAEFVKLEERQKIELLMKKILRIIHTGNVQEKLEKVKYIVEAMAVLKQPVARMIKSAESKEVGEKLAEELLAKYIGKRLRERLMEQYAKEEQTLWGLYNTITYVASHDSEIKERTRNSLINHSADMLMQELKAR